MRLYVRSLSLGLWFLAHATYAERVVVLKVDGLNQDLLARTLEERDPNTGKSQLPWINRIFVEQGAVYENFYTRGISLSAPSWSMLDTGHHAIIRGNVEYDRFTGQVYDYLNFFPLYVNYARQKQVDMPGVEVLDRAGIPLLIDKLKYPEVFQSFQLFQRGVRWTTLQEVLKRRFSSKSIFSTLEGATPSYDSLLEKQTQQELETALKGRELVYLDLFVGDVDHVGHASSDPAALLKQLREVDLLAGQLWTAIQQSPLASQTVFVMVSDHGMNNVPGVISQTYGLTDLLNSPVGGAHHIVTNREQLSDFKFKSLNPLLHRVVNPSEASFYLRGEADRYPTAWLDLDGNERASLHLRNSDLNKIHILLLQLSRADLPPAVRAAAAASLKGTIDSHRAEWEATVSQVSEELQALKSAMEVRRVVVAQEPTKWEGVGERRTAWRLRQELADWETEHAAYTAYIAHVRKLLELTPDPRQQFKNKISDFVPEMSLGDANTQRQLRHYIVGPGANGLQVGPNGELDEGSSFQYVDYPKLLADQRARNRPQRELPVRPIDFAAMRLKSTVDGHNIYWLYRDEDSQLEIQTDTEGRIAVRPSSGDWRSGLPLDLFEDKELSIPSGMQRKQWLNGWHSEREWFDAIHQTRYSNGVIGIIEQLSPVSERVPGRQGMDPVLLRYERRRRELVQADLQIFAADHWNFNVRFPNPGGNHGSFLRISTHSVWMMAGAGIKHARVREPVDSLDFGRRVSSYSSPP